MRTTNRINENELAAYQAFCIENRIAVDGDAGEKNGELFGDFIGVKMDSDFTPATLATAFTHLKGRLKFVSKMQTDADALARGLRPEEIDAYKVWAKGQKMLIGIDGSEEGYANVRSLLGWMRGNPVTGHNLDLALGNIINNPQFGRIYFKPQPKQSREVVQGRPDHAFGQEEPKPKSSAPSIQQQEFVSGRRNHAFAPPEIIAKQAAVEAPDAWQEIINLHMKEWVTPGQQAKLENELNSGLAAGRSRREIAASLGAIVRDQRRGR
jgi:hypothetical protein